MAVKFSAFKEEMFCSKVNSKLCSSYSCLSTNEIERLFELERCIRWTTTGSFKRVALQFADELLPAAVQVALALDQALPNTKHYILSDTTFSSCCVDEVSAEHAACEAIVHFGHSCLSPPSRLPVLLVFCGLKDQLSFNWQPLADLLHSAPFTCSSEPAKPMGSYERNKGSDCAYDVAVSNTSQQTFQGREVKNFKDKVEKYQQPVLFNCFEASNAQESSSLLVIADVAYSSQLEKIRLCLPQHAVLGFPVIPGEEFPLHTHSGQMALKRWFSTKVSLESIANVLWIGDESTALNNVILFFSTSSVWSYNPKIKELRRQGLSISRSLMKRYYLVEKAKDAQIIGILVGTLGTGKYIDAVYYLRKLIKHAGRKSYTLAVGKLNPAKLANFLEIDVYVYVACAENSFFDSRDFYRPVVTPYELDVALNPNRKWGSMFSTDFSDILPGGPLHVAYPDESAESPVSTRYDVSLTSGKLRNHGPSLNAITYASGLNVESSINVLEAALAVVHVSATGEALSQRSWRGLACDAVLDEEESGAVLGSGKDGIAMGYTNEGTS